MYHLQNQGIFSKNDNFKNLEELFQKLLTTVEEKFISMNEKFLKFENILIQIQKVSN